MAHYLETILGDMLYTDPVDENLKALPSPEDLKGKILIKAKKLPPGKNYYIIYIWCEFNVLRTVIGIEFKSWLTKSIF